MALVTCDDCGHKVSSEATACPSCGRPMTAQAQPAPAQPAIWPPPGNAQTSTPPAAPPSAGKQKNWFARHKVLTVILALVVIGAIAAAAGGGKSSKSGSSGTPTNVSSPGSPPVTGKVAGEFQSVSGCLGCGSLVHYIHVDKVWCGWQDGQVVIHVRFRNSSVEHVTVDWHPSYVIRDGGSHGTGLTSIQSSGVDAHATRVLTVQQSPDGVAAGSAIGQCEPAFEDVESG
jgi:hypothetical protein